MKSIRDVFKIGLGPSSSHTMGPANASIELIKKYPQVDTVSCTLYGSLALTGKGHLTDYAIINEFEKRNIKIDLKFDCSKSDLAHENTMVFAGFSNNELVYEHEIYSIGGGDIRFKDASLNLTNSIQDVYAQNNMSEIMNYCEQENLGLVDYVMKFDPKITDFLDKVFEVMTQSVENGLTKKDMLLPGTLKLARKAATLFANETDDSLIISAYAYAVSEENASGGIVVTAPTCGACGVLPAVLYFYHKNKGVSRADIIKALAVAGLFGQIIKHNATVSGAAAGCQAEIGSATAMSAAAIAVLEGQTNRIITAAAEIGLEHQLGLTCDPVKGYVQIPCIQRNAIATSKALLAAKLAQRIADTEVVDFDTVVKVMYETGKDMHVNYRETSLGGLSKYYTKGC